MAASQNNINPSTSPGANLVANGATFKTWAPRANEVYVVLHDPGAEYPSVWQKNGNDLLVKDENGHWTGFFPDV